MSNRQDLSPRQCATMISNSRSLVVLSGAGISTAAGIPDFRGPQGLYVTRQYDPEKVFDIRCFQHEPEYFYDFSKDFVAAAAKIQPTFTHKFLAKLEEQDKLKGIITQNIDLLHHQAGNDKIVELHGSYRSATCLSCGVAYPDLDYDWWRKAMEESPASPVCQCPECGGIIKPDIVFFGEMVPQFAVAEQVLADCDLLLVLGSSLQVAPASHLPQMTDAPTIIVNKGDVALGCSPQRFFIDADLDEYFRQVAETLVK